MNSRKPFTGQASFPSIIIPITQPQQPYSLTPPPSSSSPPSFALHNIPQTQFNSAITLETMNDNNPTIMSTPPKPTPPSSSAEPPPPLPDPVSYGIELPSWIDLNQNSHKLSKPSSLKKKSTIIPHKTETELHLMSRPLSPTLSTFDGKSNFAMKPPIYVRDIKLIVCMGDSLLTGLCMADDIITKSSNSHHQRKSIKSQILSYIGHRKLLLPFLPWLISGESRSRTCIAGGRNIVSVGRLIQHENPSLIGLSYRNTFMMSKGGIQDNDFNFAQSGAIIDKLPQQASRFLKKLNKSKHNNNTYFNQVLSGWKLIFIWIGANDCVIKSDNSKFEYELVSVIQKIKQSTTKSIISLISIPDLSNIKVYNRKNSTVSIITTNNDNYTKNNINQRIQDNREIINQALQNILKQYDWGDGSDFRICLQPMPVISNFIIPKEKLISHYDHLHPNALAHQLFAKAIWLNLFREDKEKLMTLDEVLRSCWNSGANENDTIKC